MNLGGKSAHLFSDLGQLILNDLRKIGDWGLKDAKKAENDTSNLELKLKFAHKLQPISKDGNSLVLVLNDGQSQLTVVVESHRHRLK